MRNQPSTVHRPPSNSNLKVAIVHDWLIGGGAEKVVLELHRLYPDAPIYTSYCSPEWREKLDDKVVTGYLQHLGKIRKFIPPLRALWFSRLKLEDYDVIISSSGNGEANHVRAPEGTIHISYCHSPTHFYWTRYDEYIANPGFGPFNWLARAGLKLLVKPLRNADYRAAQQIDYIIANSTFIQSQIKKYYDRDSTVIHPPVDVARFATYHLTPTIYRSGFIIFGRQVPSKHFDLAIKACNELKLHLTVAGRGPENARLKELAGPTITFADNPTDKEIVELLASARAFIFPCMDDFGIAPVEALAAGTPVIALKTGGALDYVVPGETGEFFTDQTVESLSKVLQNFKPSNYSSSDIKNAAKAFSNDQFVQKIVTFVQSHI